ncbi:MAG: Dodecaprenyl-phosphate galacturonate synthase [Chlamydiae bacterium]|nr:Dodecaprenyl-phosphate galacturonate synthase [Chlamydiota bacterium]
MLVTYSIIIPIKDEEHNILSLIDEIEPVMQGLNKPWELICIDDGSKDKSFEILRGLLDKKPFLKLISFTKNFGQSSAFDAGFKKAKGDFIITLDGDLQNDPRDIPLLLANASSYDMVCGWRHTRRDRLSKRMTSKISNFIRSRLCQDHMHDTGCSLKIFKKESLNRIKLFHGMHRFLPALFKMEGYKILEVKVNHRPRVGGKSKYHFFNRSIGPILDMLAVYWMRKKKLKYQVKEESK